MKTLRFILLLVALIVSALEIIFTLKHLRTPARPFTPFDAFFVAALIILISSLQKTTGPITEPFRKFVALPIFQRIFFAACIYILLIKVAYFGGYGARIVYDGWGRWF